MAHYAQGHRGRLKERFLKEGLAHFASNNVLELLLFYAVPRRDTNQLAHTLLDEFGSLSGVFDASYEDLLKVNGLGPHAASLIKVCAALVPVYLEAGHGLGDILNTTEKMAAYLVPKFLGRSTEMVYLLCLDSKMKLLYSGILFEGGIASVQINARAIAEKALAVHVMYVVLSHNHPGGFALPSLDDIRSTQQLKEALAPLSIQLLDHIIVAGSDSVSLADSGIFVK